MSQSDKMSDLPEPPLLSINQRIKLMEANSQEQNHRVRAHDDDHTGDGKRRHSHLSGGVGASCASKTPHLPCHAQLEAPLEEPILWLSYELGMRSQE
jgi:hypothetical protein